MTTPHSNAVSKSLEQHGPVFEQLENYAWGSDPEFQSGLQAILGSSPSPEQAEHLTLRARCFYFARKNDIPIDFNAYHTWRSQQSSSPANGISVIVSASNPSIVSKSSPSLDATSCNGVNTHTTVEDEEPPTPYPASFSQIVGLISSGEPVPGIKEVPSVVLQGQASQTTTTKRKKPWETDDAGVGKEVVGANN